MNKPIIEFKKIYEHDMDLLIIEEFLVDHGFARLFLDKLGLGDDYSIIKVSHSLADSDGESDITLILQYPNQKVALLIEDKIDAQTMPDQSLRYHKRAQGAISRGEYDSYYVILAAPSDYHKEHLNDGNADYQYRVCYEELRDYLSKQDKQDHQNHARAAFKVSIIEHALKEKKAGYQVQEVPAVTLFWTKLRQYCKDHYPQLHMVGSDSPKGASACWPEFHTSLGKLKIIYKSQKGFVDLEFPKYGDKTADLLSIVKSKMSPNMQIWQTGKSASVRISNERWCIDFNGEFETYKDTVDEVLQAVSTLCDFASSLNYIDIY